MSKFFNYSQPDFYHFGNDSVLLANLASSKFSQPIESLRILDLGAGCGIVGMECLLNLFESEVCQKITLYSLEKQLDFQEHWEENRKQILKFLKNPSYISMDLITSDWSTWQSKEKFDLILGNLPYFLEGKGRIASDQRRQICRFSSESNLSFLPSLLQENLQIGSSAYFIMRQDLFDVFQRLFASFDISTCERSSEGKELIIKLSKRDL